MYFGKKCVHILFSSLSLSVCVCLCVFKQNFHVGPTTGMLYWLVKSKVCVCVCIFYVDVFIVELTIEYKKN